MSELTAQEIFEKILPESLIDNEKAAKVHAVYQFVINDGPDSKTWTVDLNKTEGHVSEGGETKPDCTLEMTADNFVKLWTGELNGMKAMMMGKLKIKGNMGLATKLQAFIG